MRGDITAICEGIAANLATIRDNDPTLVKQIHPFPLRNPTGTALLVHGIVEQEYLTFGSVEQPPGMRYLVGVEAYFGTADQIGNHQKLRRLLTSVGDDSLVSAVEAEGTERARLTARLNHDGELLEDQDPACESISFEEYRGHAYITAPNNTEYMVATWIFEVMT
jgi:hypothetical protein